jgi:WD40 repeat protein
MARRCFAIVGLLFLLAGIVWLPLGAGEKTGKPDIVFKGHTDAVYAVAFSPDGKYLITASFDHTLKLWETATGKEVKTYGGATGHAKQVISVAFNQDGSMIASGSTDNTLKVWDVPVNAPIRSLRSSDSVQAVALSPDGLKLAIGGKDGSLKLVAPADFKELVKFQTGHQGAITSLAFSANGQLLASVGVDHTLRYWNVANGQLVATVGAHMAGVNAVAVNPNNTAVYTVGGDGYLKFWSLPSPPSKTLPGHGAPIRALAMTADNTAFYTGSDDRTVRHFTIAGAKEVRSLAGPQSGITSVATHPTNAFIAAGTLDSRVFLWNNSDAKVLTSWLAHAWAVHSVQVHPQGQQLMTAGADGLVKFWALPPVLPRTMTHPDAVLAAASSFDGKKLYTGCGDKFVRIWDTTKQVMEKQFAGHAGPVTAVAVSSNLQILASGSADNTIRLWNQATAKESAVLLAHAAPLTALGINAAGTQMVSASEDSTVKLWALPLVAPKLFTHPDPITCMVLTPDGGKILTGGNDKIIRLWNLTSGAKERDYPGPTLPIVSAAISSNGKSIAAAALDKSVFLWNVADAKVLQKLPMPAVPQAVAFSADSQSVFVGLADNSIKQITIADGKDIQTFPAQPKKVSGTFSGELPDFHAPASGPEKVPDTFFGLALSPKGDLLFSASADKTIQTFALPGGAPKAKFEHVAPIVAMTLSKDGTRLAAVAQSVVKVWTVADSKEVGTWKLAADAKGISLSPDNTRLIVAGVDKLARIYEVDGKLLETLPHDGPVQAVAFVDAKKVVTGGADKLARLWTSALVWQRQHQGPVRQAVFTPKGDQIVSTGDDKTIKLWSAADGKEVKSLTNESPISHLSLSADATKIATASADKNVKIWNFADGKTSAAIALGAAAQGLTLSPNGQRIAVALAEGPNNVIRVHDVALGKDIQVFTDHAAALKSLQFLADGRTLVSASADKTARLLDVGVISALAAHQAGPTFAQYHNTGMQIVTAGADKTVKLWDLARSASKEPSVLKSFGPVADPIKAVTFSRDFNKIGVAAGKKVLVWSITDGKQIVTLTHPVDVLSLSFSQDGTRIATGAADKQTRLWEVATGNPLQFFAQDDPVDAVIHLPNNLLISAAGKAACLDTASIVRQIPADAGPVHGLAIIPANSHVLTAGADKIAKLWNLTSGAMERPFAGATAPLRSVAISKNGALVAAGGADQTVRVYQFADSKEIGSFKVAGEVRTISFTPNNLALVASSAAKTLQAVEVPFTPGQPLAQEFLKPVQSFTPADVLGDFIIAGDSASIYSAGADKAMHVWKLASPAPTRNFAYGTAVDAVAFQPNGTLLGAAGHDGKVRFFDLVKNAQAKEISAHIRMVQKNNVPQPVYSLTFSPDGKQLLTSSYDNSIKLWEVASGNLIREFKPYTLKDFEKGHQEPVYTAALSPDGKFIASGSSGLERTIKIWNVGDGSVARDLANPNYKTAPMFPPTSHPGAVTNLRFTKDGKYLISVGDAPGNKGFLAVWDWQAGKLVSSDTMQLGVFYGLALAPDEKSLAVGAGNRDRKFASPDFNAAYLLKLPIAGK